MELTLYDIFYKHKWYEKEQDKYHEVLAEMKKEAVKYASGLNECKNWKYAIEKETIELCRANHYSWALKDESRKWHDLVQTDFLLIIKTAMEHYGYDFRDLPYNIQSQYGIKHYKDGKLQKGDNKSPKIIPLPDCLNTERAQKAILKAIKAGYIKKCDKNKLEWVNKARGAKTQLAYFCVKCWCPNNNETLPESAINALFDVSRIGQAVSSLNDRKKELKWKGQFDALFN